MKRSLITGKAFLGGILVGILLLIVLFGLIRVTYPSSQTVLFPTAVMKVIRADPTGMRLPGQTPIPALTATLDPVKFGGIGLGQYVQIIGTGGDGLRLRSGAGIENPPLFLGYEDEVFLVQEGPLESSEMVWWFLVSPSDETRKGWASGKFLALITTGR